MGRGSRLIRVIVLGALVASCGGRQEIDPSEDGATVATVDLTQAPATFTATCDGGIGTVAFRNPCSVGQKLGGDQVSAFGVHEVECSLATIDHPMTWSFLLSLAAVASSPDMRIALPGTYATKSPTSGATVVVNGRLAGLSDAAGTLSFSRLDPTNRAFIARFKGTMSWTDATGGTFSCAVDSPLWGAPGSFL